MVFTAMLLLNYKPSSTVFLVYSTQDLLEKDRNMIDTMKGLMKPGQRLKTKLAKDKFKPKEDDIALIDECDDIYFNNLKWFEAAFKDSSIIGFTASVPTQRERIETLILEKFF